jgi:hypothetical protein
MTRTKKILIGLAAALASYPLLLLLLGYALAGSVEERVRERLGFALQADEVEVGEVDVSLLRGRILVTGIHAKRNGVGTATVDIKTLDIGVASFGWVLFDQEPRSVAVDSAHLELSAVGAATLQSDDSPPLRVDEFTIKNSSVTLVATSFFPSMGKAELQVERAHASNLEMNNAISWLYKTDELVASLRAPGDLKLGLQYGDEAMSVSGSILGSDPITVPFLWPVPDPRELELEQILSLASTLSKLVAQEYAKRKAKGLWDNVTEVLDDD